jgi:hypothetical protein
VTIDRTQTTPREIAERLGGAIFKDGQWYGLCPCHDDHTASLALTEKDGRLLWYCRAGCSQGTVQKALEDLGILGKTNGHDTSAGLTLARYASVKRLPESFLRSLWIKDTFYAGAPAVEMPYPRIEGEPAIKYRISLDGPTKTKWKKGHKACLYGEAKLPEITEYVVIVEGESDTQTLLYHGFHAVGLPGAGGWKENRDAALFDHIPLIFVVIEPDAGGRNVIKWLARSEIASRARLVRMPPEAKDPSALYLSNPVGFVDAFGALRDGGAACSDGGAAGSRDCQQAGAIKEKCARRRPPGSPASLHVRWGYQPMDR